MCCKAISLLPANATESVRKDLPYLPMYSNARSVRCPDVDSLVSLLQFRTMAPNPSSIGSPVAWSGWCLPIIHSRNTLSSGQFCDMVITAALVIVWQKYNIERSLGQPREMAVRPTSETNSSASSCASNGSTRRDWSFLQQIPTVSSPSSRTESSTQSVSRLKHCPMNITI
uniref:Uncharacterized protein n=1 Tax=Arundo donax TaxID=35708 RepID=A0A0A9DFA0_ARUDO